MFWQLKDILTYITLKITLSLVTFTPLFCIISHKFYNIYIYIYIYIYISILFCALNVMYLTPENCQYDRNT